MRPVADWLLLLSAVSIVRQIYHFRSSRGELAGSSGLPDCFPGGPNNCRVGEVLKFGGQRVGCSVRFTDEIFRGEAEGTGFSPVGTVSTAALGVLES